MIVARLIPHCVRPTECGEEADVGVGLEALQETLMLHKEGAALVVVDSG